MKISPPFGIETLDQHIALALHWVKGSIQAAGGKGSAAYYHLWKGWSESYPETTGYLIETLFDCFQITKSEALKAAALECADWLCDLQRPYGAFPGGVGGKLAPIIFDTGMILFGLRRAWEETNQRKYLNALAKAVKWLEAQLEEDGIWRSHAYVLGHVPSYYTMVVWAMLLANKHLKNKGLNERLAISIDYFFQKITSELTISDWNFRPGEPTFTHTIGYTLQGMLEAGLLLKNKEIVSQVKAIAEKMLVIRHEKGKLAGSYNKNWKGDYSFSCLTGQAQMSLIFFRLHEISGEQKFLNEAQLLLWQTMKSQSTVKIEGWNGGIPGSAPIWGKYQRFQFPNWAAKFFLDACLAARRI